MTIPFFFKVSTQGLQIKLENSAEKSEKPLKKLKTDRLGKLCFLKACKAIRVFHQPQNLNQ